MKNLLGAMLGVSLLLTLPWMLIANDIALTGFFSPKREEIRREVFENTRSFEQGTAQNLEQLYREYMNADPAHQAIIASMVRDETANLDTTNLNPQLKSFIEACWRK